MLSLLDIRINIRARHDPHPVHSIFDTHLFVFVTKAIRIHICIRDYPCSNPNPIENVKTNTISTISVCIRSVYIPTRRCRGAARRPALERRQQLARPLVAAAHQTAPAHGGGRKMRKGSEGREEKVIRERERGGWGVADKRNERCWSRIYCPGSSPHPGLKGTI